MGEMPCSDEDISLYSKAFYGRYRERSLSMAARRTAELASSNDIEGVAVWEQVAQKVKDLAAADGLYLGTAEGISPEGEGGDAV
jgi:hypothetical protein